MTRECGCHVSYQGGYTYIERCDLHESAPLLLATLKAVLLTWERGASLPPHLIVSIYNAIATAEEGAPDMDSVEAGNV